MGILWEGSAEEAVELTSQALIKSSKRNQEHPGFLGVSKLPCTMRACH